jgi:hypothetical protein
MAAAAARHSLAYVLAFTAFFSGSTAAAAPGTTGAPRITAATNITLRQTPSADSPVLAYLPIGTEVTEVGPLGMDKTWLRVRLADNREGWLLANLTRVVEPARRTSTVEAIIVDRLGRRGDGPAATIELADFVERESRAVTDPEAAARFDLYQLRAVSTTLSALRLNLGKRDPYMAWLDRHKTLIAYDEPGGRWILSNAAIWQIHDDHPDAAAADEIAWLAATTGLPGECGGVLACYVDTLNRLYGEYLRRHPAGHHADEAVAKIKDAADQLSVPAKTQPQYLFDVKRDCSPLTKATDGLSAAVSGATALGKEAALQCLAGLKMCKTLAANR